MRGDGGAMYGDEEEVRRRRRWPWVMALLVLVFLGGAAAAGYAVTQDERLAGLLGLVPAEQADARVALARHIAVAAATRAAPVATPAPDSGAATPDPELAGQIASLTERLDDLETQARTATGDASRAEGLLVAFAARRALDRGMQLGYIEGLLRQRFGHLQPDAVAAILSAARTPITLADLQTGLDGASPTLAADGDAVRDSWWQTVRREFTGMVVVRRADQPSALPADRVARATRMLEGGQVDGALAEVLRLPNHQAAAAWIVNARRYLTGRGALDRIETAALLQPDAPGATAAPSGWPAAAPAAKLPALAPAATPSSAVD